MILRTFPLYEDLVSEDCLLRLLPPGKKSLSVSPPPDSSDLSPAVDSTSETTGAKATLFLAEAAEAWRIISYLPNQDKKSIGLHLRLRHRIPPICLRK